MTDVQVDADGILSVLDNQRGRVFQYDKEQNPLCIFGGRGEQQGFFKNATALEKLGSEYLIADADKNSLTVFAPVPYMETVRLALAAYDAGDYEKSAALWEETLRQNGSLTVAMTRPWRASKTAATAIFIRWRCSRCAGSSHGPTCGGFYRRQPLPWPRLSGW